MWVKLQVTECTNIDKFVEKLWHDITVFDTFIYKTAWTQQGIVSHFNIYMIRTRSKLSKYATLMKRSKNNQNILYWFFDLFLYLPQLKEAVYFILVIIYVIYIVRYAKYWENREVPSKGTFTVNTCHLTPDESLVFTCNQESSNR